MGCLESIDGFERHVFLFQISESHASAYGEKDISLGSQEKPLTLCNGGPTSSTEDDLEKTSPDVIPMPSMPLGSVGATRPLQGNCCT